MSLDLIIQNVRPRGAQTPLDVAISGGLIVEIGAEIEAVPGASVLDGCGGLMLPAFVNPHLHLDKTLVGAALRPARYPGNAGLRAVNERHRIQYTPDEVADRASRVVELSLQHGTTAIRAFADVAPVTETTGIQGLIRLRERYADELSIQVNPFPQDGLYTRPGLDALLVEAVDLGTDTVGGLPSAEATETLVEKHARFVIGLAADRGLDVHMLLDESDSPTSRALEHVARATIERGWEGRVTVGPVNALGAYDHPLAERVVELVAAAGLNVCLNPHISLVLQGRHDRGLIRRGMTRVSELLAAGVNVIAGQDDVDDPWYALGQADQLEVAQYVAHTAHLAWPDELETVIDMVTVNAARALGISDGYGLAAGDRADLVVIDAPDILEAVRHVAPRRLVISRGRLVSETRTTHIRHPIMEVTR